MFPTSLPMTQNVSMSVPSLTTSTALPFGLQFPMTGPAGLALSSSTLSVPSVAGPSATITISPQVLQALLQQQQQQMMQAAGAPLCVTSMRVETPQQIQAKFALNCSCAACASGNSSAHQTTSSAPSLPSSPFFINYNSSSTAFASASASSSPSTVASPTPASAAPEAPAMPLQIPITLSLPGLSMLPMNYPLMNLPLSFGMTPTPALVPTAPPTPEQTKEQPQPASDESLRGLRKRNTTKRYQCTECPKKFHQRSNLITHVRTHTGEKPFGCPFPDCGRRFSQSSNLRRHQRIHVREGGAPSATLASPSSAALPKHKLKPLVVKNTVLSPVADSLSPVSSRSGSVSPTGSARSGSSSLASVSASSSSHFSTPHVPFSDLSLGSAAQPNTRPSLVLHPSPASSASATLSLSTPSIHSASSSAAASAFSALMSPKGKISPSGTRRTPGVSAPLLDSLLQATMTAAAEEGSVSRS